MLSKGKQSGHLKARAEKAYFCTADLMLLRGALQTASQRSSVSTDKLGCYLLGLTYLAIGLL